MTVDHIKDVFLHMKWADATVWKAVHASAEATPDPYVLDTLMHIHETQQAFLNAWLNRPFERWKRSEIGAASELCAWGESFYDAAFDYLDSLTDADLDRPMVVPWAKYFARTLGRDPAESTLRETLHQVVSHSMHHRGQVARRLRELEADPPLTDYIVWLWADRPAPEWPK